MEDNDALALAVLEGLSSVMKEVVRGSEIKTEMLAREWGSRPEGTQYRKVLEAIAKLDSGARNATALLDGFTERIRTAGLRKACEDLSNSNNHGNQGS